MLKIKSQLERQKDIQYHTGSVLVKRCTVLLKGKKRNESDIYEKNIHITSKSCVLKKCEVSNLFAEGNMT